MRGLEPSGSPGEKKKRNPNVFTVAPIGRKKSASTFLHPKKKYIWRRANIKGAFKNLKVPVDFGFQIDSGFHVALRVQRRAARAPWGLPTLDLGSTFGQRSVNLGYLP